MSTTSPKHLVYTHFAAVARALGHTHKLELLELLGQRERNVEDLAHTAGLSVANTSQHLQQLRRVGLITSRKDGLFVFYRIADDDVVALLRSLRRSAERHVAEVSNAVFEYFTARDSLEPIGRTELMQRSRDGRVTILDVRPSEEYRAGHIPGALNIPSAGLTRCLGALPRDQEIIAYCRGEYCVFAYDAVAALRENGFDARRLEEGFPEWKAAGLPVEAL